MCDKRNFNCCYFFIVVCWNWVLLELLFCVVCYNYVIDIDIVNGVLVCKFFCLLFNNVV